MAHELLDALDALDATALPSATGDDARAALADRIVERIERTPAPERLALVDALRLPVSTRPLGRFAVAVLRVLVDDPALRRHHADAAMQMWLQIDEHSAVPVALAVAEHLNTTTLFGVATRVDAEERFELLAGCFARDPAMLDMLAHVGGIFAHGEDRWVPLALQKLLAAPDVDGPHAIRLLQHIGTPRAAEELAGYVERAPHPSALAFAALSALAEMKPSPELIASLLHTPMGTQLLEQHGWQLTRLVGPRKAELTRLLADAPRLVRALARVPESVEVRAPHVVG